MGDEKYKRCVTSFCDGSFVLLILIIFVCAIIGLIFGAILMASTGKDVVDKEKKYLGYGALTGALIGLVGGMIYIGHDCIKYTSYPL